MIASVATRIDNISPELFSERRIVGRALRNWDDLRTGDTFPLRSECLASFDSGILSGKILIEINEYVENDLILDCGPNFIAALGRDPTGLPAQTVLPSSTDRGLVFWRFAAELKKPIADIGNFTNMNNIEVLYRCIFLPVSEDGERISHLLGAFSYRMIH
jgi:hypothetical protein